MIAKEEFQNQEKLTLHQQGPQQPKFVSRKEREQQLKHEQEQKLAEKRQQERANEGIRRQYDEFKYREWKRQQQQQDDVRRAPPPVRSRSRSKERDRDHSRYITSNTRATVPVKLEGEDKQLMSIKLQYLGLNREKKKILKPSEKFKNIFNFEWDSTEDTSIDYNPLYQNRLEANLLFGRGNRAGFDFAEQRKNAVKYEELIQQAEPDEKQDAQKEDTMEARHQKPAIYDITEADHWSMKAREDMSQRDWRIFREDMDIVIKGGRVPNPIREWNEAQLHPVIQDAVIRLNYKRPTAIQMQTIPIGLERKDLIGIAPTGSGKSAAFLIPLINYLMTLPPQDDQLCKDGPYALILAPARELAIQIEEEFSRLAIGTHLRSFVVVGGRREEEQAFHLKRGIEVLIGTPGRIKESLLKKFLVLDQCSWAVLDEADKMIDLGFEGDVNFILDSITTMLKSTNETIAEQQERLARSGQQLFRVTHLFSATMPVSVEKLAKKYLRAFCFISIGEPGGGKKDIEQKIELMNEANKKHRLLSILQSATPPIIIFANQKKSVELLAKILEKNGVHIFKISQRNAVIYHGSKTQQQRESAVDGFKSRQYDILIATDLASRGLHVEGVQMVINFDAPKNILDFIHRTGRTGRAGKKGIAVTFLTSADEELFYDLKDYLVKNDQHVPPELDQHPATRIKPGSVPDNQPRRKQVIYAS